MKSIELNGFVLSNAVTPAVTNQTGIFLYGGVQTLSFASIDAQVDTRSMGAVPGRDRRHIHPLKVQPSIYLNSITNLVFNSSTDTTTIPTTPVTSPSVQFVVNGVIRNFDVVSVGQGAVPAAYQFRFPIVGTTGRTAVQATAINRVNVVGSSKNLTLSHSSVPFQNDGSGLKYLKKGTFGGNADALGIDVNGKIGKLTFKKGLGDPTGVNTQDPPETHGRFAGHSVRNSRGVDRLSRQRLPRRLRSGPSTFTRSRSVRPTCRSRRRRTHCLSSRRIRVFRCTFSSPGFALSNVIVATSGSIDNVDILGIQQQSEIKTGFDFSSYVAGLEGTRAASAINALNANGDQINSAISASYRPVGNTNNHGAGILWEGPDRREIQG